MADGSYLVAWVPAVIALAASVALFIAYRSMSRVPHALIWSAACTAASLRWMIAAMSAKGPMLSLASAGIGDVAAILLVLLYVEGLRRRLRGTIAPWPEYVQGGICMAAVASAALLPLFAAQGGVLPLLAVIVLTRGANMVFIPRRRATTTEYAMLMLLATLIAINLVALIAATMDPTFLGQLRQAIAIPVAAALGLASIMLLASDFSIEHHRVLHTDPLTGVLTRAGFEEAAGAALRRGRPGHLSMAIADIDRFKTINDLHGHAAGDAALVCGAALIVGGLGRNDIVGRIGGDEFAMLLAAANGEEALARIEPMRSAISDACSSVAPGLRITASFGVAERKRDDSLAALLARADRALYLAKRLGRDRVALDEPVIA